MDVRSSAMEKEQQNSVVFNVSKKELFSSSSGFKSLQKRLRAQWKIQRQEDTPVLLLLFSN